MNAIKLALLALGTVALILLDVTSAPISAGITAASGVVIGRILYDALFGAKR